MTPFARNLQYYKFCLYGFLKNLNMYEPFFLLFLLEKGLTYTQIGSLYAARELGINILEIPTGILADIFGRRRTMMFSFAVYISSFIVFYMADGYWSLFLAMLFYSVGEASRTGTHKAMIFDYLKINQWAEHKTQFYGRTRGWSQFGASISALLGALAVIYTDNYRVVFLISTVPYFIGIFLIWSYPTNLDGAIKNATDLHLRHKFVEYYRQSLLSFKRKEIWLAFTNISVYDGYFKSINDYLQPLVVMSVGLLFGLSSSQLRESSAYSLGFIYFVVYLISVVSARNAYRMVYWLNSDKRLLNLSLVVGAIGGLFSGLLSDLSAGYWAVVIFVLIFIVQNVRKTVGTSFIAHHVDDSVLATGLSIESQLDSLFAAFFAMLLGVLADYVSVGFALSIAGVVLLLITPFIRLKNQIFS